MMLWRNKMNAVSWAIFLFPFPTATMANVVDLRLSDFLLPDGAEVIHLSKVHKLRPGDHLLVRFKLYVPGNSNCLGVSIDAWHHGIFTGMEEDDLWVIDMGPADREALKNPLLNVPANIQKRTLADFVGQESHLAVYRYPNTIDTPGHRALVLERAWELLHADLENQPEYNVLIKDCEAFAVYCWTGRYVKDRLRLTELVSVHQFNAGPCSKLLGAPEHRRNYSSRQS
jgi:hypothetical protein